MGSYIVQAESLSSHVMRTDVVDWTKHWSSENQQSISQRFFSLYRKTIFARTVQFFVDKYFPSSGVIVEAGSGTSETSIRVNKYNGARTLVAVDIILSVLKECDPVMDNRVGGDIFHLSYRDNSVDGVWNVGVMEHFTHDQIDQIMREFYRVLKPGAPILLLWPGTSSIPQRMLRLAEKLINITTSKNGDDFRFHPAEISQLGSSEEGCDVLNRNGFRVVQVDSGARSLMAFITLVGVKN